METVSRRRLETKLDGNVCSSVASDGKCLIVEPKFYWKSVFRLLQTIFTGDGCQIAGRDNEYHTAVQTHWNGDSGSSVAGHDKCLTI